jgi:hypothetical protein
MRQLNLKLTLREDLVATDGAATEGGHAGLDYLPGLLLLGAAAARLYADPDLSRADAYRLFHSGEVRFGDALPLVDDHPGWPMPLCWHEAKGEPAEADGQLVPGKVRNLQFGRFPDAGVQPKQLRADHVRADGRRLKVERSLRMKTAIDPRTGRVAEAQLFGYESIHAGWVFAARIQATGTLPNKLWKRLTEALTQDGELLLGRSRSAEYGRVQVESLTDGCSLEPMTDPQTSRQLTLWCLSDLALLDDWGQETLTPEPKALGLSRGAIDWDRTFLRFRRYAVWNAYRNGFDLERQVIQRGSVIALTLADSEAPWTADERAGLAAGVGLYREAGLGWLVPDPLLLGRAEPEFAPAFKPKEGQETPPLRPAHSDLLDWLEAGTKGATDRSTAEGTARGFRDALKERYRLARAFAGVPDTLPIGPSPAQWGTVYEAARTADSQQLDQLKGKLFGGTNPICKPVGEGWQDQFRDDRGVRSFFAWFSSQFDGTPQPTVAAIRFFSREALRVAQGVHGRVERERTQPAPEKT